MGGFEDALNNYTKILGPGVSTYGETVKNAIVSKIKGSLPGNVSQMIGTGPSFRSIFYPNYQSKKYEGNVQGWTNWSDFSVALLCQSIYTQSNNAKNSINPDPVNNDVNRYNNDVTPNLAPFYGYVLVNDFEAFRTPFNVLSSDLPKAKSLYRQALINSIGLHDIWFISGQWKSPDYEMFHHYVKYMTLGASFDEVNQLIDELMKGGLPIPPVVQKASWRNYTSWGYSPLSHSDVDADARDGIFKSMYIPSPYYSPPMKEGYSYEFIAHGQPGSKYLKSSGGSCFTQGTMVLLGDAKTLVEISTLRAGEYVWSPAFQSAVPIVAISKPSLNGRALYQIDDIPFYFTGTHPFVIQTSEGHPNHNRVCAAAMEQHLLRLHSPTWSAIGLSNLNASSDLLEICISHDQENQSPSQRVYHIKDIKVHSNNNENNQNRPQEETHDTYLYDIILASPGMSHLDEGCDWPISVDYVVGSADRLFRVGSEFPPLLTSSPEIMLLGLDCIRSLSLHSNRILKIFTDSHLNACWSVREKCYQKIAQFTSASSMSFVYQAYCSFFNNTNDENRNENKIEKGYNKASLSSSLLHDAASLFRTSEEEGGQWNWVLSRLFESFILTHTFELYSLIEFGYRSFNIAKEKLLVNPHNNVLAVTVWGTELNSSLDVNWNESRSQRTEGVYCVSLNFEETSHDPIQLTPLRAITSQSILSFEKSAPYWVSGITSSRVFHFDISKLPSIIFRNDNDELNFNEALFEIQIRICEAANANKSLMEGSNRIKLDKIVSYQHGKVTMSSVKEDEEVFNPFSPTVQEIIEEGTTYFDVRILSAEEAELEERNAKKWTLEHSLPFISSFSPHLSQSLSSSLQSFFKDV